jgi:hypothetical protein
MIPNALTACRGFVMRKVAGRFDACRQLVSSTGARVSHPSLLATVGVFLLMILPVLLLLAAALAALHDPGNHLVALRRDRARGQCHRRPRDEGEARKGAG